METIKFNLLALVTALFFGSCTIEPEQIAYGKDQCSYCRMSIADKTHAAQYVTKKGKQFKFDAIECMINDLTDKDEAALDRILVADYNHPGKMIDAKNAAYVVSKMIKSPMGAYLSAVSTMDEANGLITEKGGTVYTWETIKKHIRN